jgi:hypothetical protein
MMARARWPLGIVGRYAGGESVVVEWRCGWGLVSVHVSAVSGNSCFVLLVFYIVIMLFPLMIVCTA